MVCCN